MKLRSVRVLCGYTHNGRTADERTNSLKEIKGVDQKHDCCKMLVHKVSNIRRHIDNMSCCLYVFCYYHILSYFL